MAYVCVYVRVRVRDAENRKIVAPPSRSHFAAADGGVRRFFRFSASLTLTLALA